MAVSFLTIVLFFVYLWGLGFTATYFVKKPESFFERQMLNLAIGLGIFPILSILLNFLHIPLDWKIFLFLSSAFPIFILFEKFKIPSFKFKLKKSDLVLLLVILIAVSSFYVYTKGAFSYPYLEDEDPWGHSVGVKYVALEKNAYDPDLQVEGKSVDPILSYIDPYPPAYDVFMGVLHQTSPDMQWTLKFFNALIISLGFVFFYLFAARFMGNRNKALFATFVLSALPSYFSHFIWAHSLVITLFFPAMYAFERIREDKRWMYIALLMVASIWVSQNLSQPVKLSTMLLLYLIIISVTHRKFFVRSYLAFVGGMGVSFLWWGMMIKKHTLQGFLKYYVGDTANVADKAILGTLSEGTGIISFVLIKFVGIIKKLTGAGGSGARAYSFEDFFIAKGQNMINNPIGIGKVVTILVLVTVVWLLWKHRSRIVEKKNTWIVVTLFWLIFTFWGVMGKTFPISVAKATFRVWMILAIPVSMIAAEGFHLITSFFSRPKMLKWGVALLIIVGVLLTSAQAKYELNTARWPTSGSFTNSNEPYQYGEWFQSIPLNTNVFLYAPRDKLTIGYGGFSCIWCQDVHDFRNEILYKDVDELYSFLKDHDYKYFVINGNMDFKYFSNERRFGQNDTKELLPKRYNEISSSGFFVPVHQVENSFVVFEIK